MNDSGGGWKYAHVGLQLAAGVLLGLWGGYKLDGRFGTLPWLTLLGAAAGLGLGFYLFFREVMEDGKK